MRTLRLAVTLLALAVFIGATIVAADAANVPGVISTPVKKTVATTAKVPTLAKLPALKMLSGLEKFSQANDAAGNAVKLEAAKMAMGTRQDISVSAGKASSKLSLAGMRTMPQLQLGKMLNAYGMNMPALTTLGNIK